MEADKIRRWGAKWATIRDASQTAKARTYAENYLAMLRRQLAALAEAQQ